MEQSTDGHYARGATVMTDHALRLTEQPLRLLEADRLELARALWDSLDSPEEGDIEEDAGWIAELNRRADDLTAGRATAEPADQVLAQLRDESMREHRSR
jgi:putative addiction module component (TIGR02574 family)